MGIEAKTNQYWIAPSAVTITLNALGNPNRTQGSVASGAVISCYVEEVKPESAGPEYAGNGDGLGLDNGRNPKRWPLSLSPTYFNSNTAKYVYVAIPRKASFSTQAVVVFPSERLDIYGKNAEGAQIGSTDYFYVWLQGVISATDGNVNRTWTVNNDFGSLGTYEDIMDMSETDWYQYSKVTGIVTFLKQIVMGDDSKFQNLKALKAVIEQKLTLGSGTTRGELTGVATDDNYESVSEDSDTHIVTPSYLDEFGNTRYLSKVNDDVAQGVITFLKGIKIGQAAQFGIDKDGNATLYDIIFNHILKSSGAEKGIDTGHGIIMDASDGTIEADGFIVRGWAMFRKLIYNYLEIMEQDYQFSGGGDIEEVVDNGNMTYTCYLHKEKEGRHQDIAAGDILYGKVDDETGEGGHEYYTSWMKVKSVTQNDGYEVDEQGNPTDKLKRDVMVVSLWDDNMVPGGRNFPPKSFMTVARRGNVADGIDNDGHYSEQQKQSQKLRQAFWELSTTDHNITHYWRVDQPILREDNYAAVFGIMPTKLQQEVLPETSDFTKPGLYASEIFYEHLTPIKYPAKIVKEDRGDWTATPTSTYNSDLDGTWTPTFDTITVHQGTPQEKTYGLYAQHLAAACGITTQGGSITVAAGDIIPDPYHYKTFTLQEWLTERLSASNASLTDAQLEQKMLVEWKKDLEVSRTWNNGILWECLIDGTVNAPIWNCSDWQAISGDTVYYCEVLSSAGSSFRNGNVDTILTMSVRFGLEDIADRVKYPIRSVEWKRKTGWDDTAKTFVQTPEDRNWQPNYTDVGRLSVLILRSDMGSGWMTDYRRAAFECTVSNGEEEPLSAMRMIL